MDPLDTKVWVILDDSEEIERGLVAVNSPDGDRMWGDPDLHEDDDWEVVAPKQELRVPVTLLRLTKGKISPRENICRCDHESKQIERFSYGRTNFAETSTTNEGWTSPVPRVRVFPIMNLLRSGLN
ncbi:hypothetical protein LINPERPRIM_LOCUS11066 [Linum perenne]